MSIEPDDQEELFPDIEQVSTRNASPGDQEDDEGHSGHHETPLVACQRRNRRPTLRVVEEGRPCLARLDFASAEPRLRFGLVWDINPKR